MGKDMCSMTMQILSGEEAFCSETIVCKRRTNLVPPNAVEKDRFGNPIDPLKAKLEVDPSNFIDLSSETIMPVFNENSFVFFLETEDFIKG
mgnify:CR=1 FL=1